MNVKGSKQNRTEQEESKENYTRTNMKTEHYH